MRRRVCRRCRLSGGVLLGWDAPESGAVSGYRVLRRSPERGERTLSGVGVRYRFVGDVVFGCVGGGGGRACSCIGWRRCSTGRAGKRSERARVRYEAPEAEPSRCCASVEPEADVEAVADVVLLSGVLSVGSQGGVSPVMSGFSSWARAGSLVAAVVHCGWFCCSGVGAGGARPGVCFWRPIRPWAPISFWTLGGQEFVGSDSLVPALAVRGAYWWPSGGLSWSDGDTVDVELRVAADAVPIGERDAAPLWAYFDRVPDTHDGTRRRSVCGCGSARTSTLTAAALRDSVIVSQRAARSPRCKPAADSTRNWTVTDGSPTADSDVTRLCRKRVFGVLIPQRCVPPTVVPLAAGHLR